MELATSFGTALPASTLAMSGLEPVLWSVVGLIAVCVGLLAYDALWARTPGGGPETRRSFDRLHHAT